jgi:hypothetical protein
MQRLFLVLFFVMSIHALHGVDRMDPQNLTKIPENGSQEANTKGRTQGQFNKLNGKSIFALQKMMNRNVLTLQVLQEKEKEVEAEYSKLTDLENMSGISNHEKARLQEEVELINLQLEACRVMIHSLHSDNTIANRRQGEILWKWRLVIAPCCLVFLWKTPFYFALGIWTFLLCSRYMDDYARSFATKYCRVYRTWNCLS